MWFFASTPIYPIRPIDLSMSLATIALPLPLPLPLRLGGSCSAMVHSMNVLQLAALRIFRPSPSVG